MDREDPYHAVCADLIANTPGPMLVPDLVLAELGQMVHRDLGVEAEAMVFRSLVASTLSVIHTEHDDLVRAVELLETYADLGLGIVDASVVAIAERLNIDTIATLDRRHFLVIQPRHIDRFTLVPGPAA